MYKYKQVFELRLCNRGFPSAPLHKILTEVQFSDRAQAKTKKAFVTTQNPTKPKEDSRETLIQRQRRLGANDVSSQPPLYFAGKNNHLRTF